MNYLQLLSEDETNFICSIIPVEHAVSYFKQNPKGFAKICPGFRASSVAKLNVPKLLFKNRNRGFVEFFIEKHISDWLSQIQKHLDECLSDGDSEETAQLKTLPYCVFVDNIGIYCKLKGKVFSAEDMNLLSESIKMIRDAHEESKQLNSSLRDKSSEIARQTTELEQAQSDLNKAKKKLNEQLVELRELRHTVANLEKLRDENVVHKQAIETLEERICKHEDYIQRLQSDLSEAKDEKQLLESKIKEKLKRQQEEQGTNQSADKKPKQPKNMEEFKEYLGYNFENIGMPTSECYFALLKDYLSDILFRGQPIIIGRNTAFPLIKCVSNTLIKTPIFPVLEFASDITEKTVSTFLSQDKRILCVDNFIGNYNETVLFTACDKHRDKIIFLTVAYDRTLHYISEELLKYCNYLNLSRIETFSGYTNLTEDPSQFDEEDISDTAISPDVRWSVVLKEILGELRICSSLSIQKSSLVIDEMSMCRTLVFDILPYCVDALKMDPFNVSDRLVKYAGNSGRCKYKDLFWKWFA